MTSDVTAKEYHLRIMKKSLRMLDELSEIAQVRCIEDVTSDLRENYMKFDTEGNGKEYFWVNQNL